jgi:hypothetical protein
MCVSSALRHTTRLTTPSLWEENGERRALLEAQAQKMIQERQLKVEEFKHSGELSNRDAELDIADGVQVFTALVCSIERSQANYIWNVNEKKKSAERWTGVCIKELEQEITGDHLLQNVSSLHPPTPHPTHTHPGPGLV